MIQFLYDQQMKLKSDSSRITQTNLSIGRAGVARKSGIVAISPRINTNGEALLGHVVL